ncbi:MAG: hypothetical protein R3B82_23725 [Sandaracinaceae bacterium]
MSPEAPIAEDRPSHVYYRACVGSWRATMQLTLTDAARLAGSGMSLLDRLSVRLMSAWPSWLRRPILETTVAFDGPDEVRHTTVVRWLGLPFQKSVELFSLAADGRRFTVRGGMTGDGSIDATATRGEYHLRWLGVEILQRTERDADRVTVRQEGPGFRGHQTLIRQ